ncbi:MAG: hypothetical protein IH985_06090 [Planctomycetes bacterium]|nr:hypothetical protein [Planctomycetota bacterium]
MGVGRDRDARDVASLRGYMYETAKERGLAERYLSEGRIGVAEVEQALASARALEVEHTATLMGRYAALDAERQDVASRARSSLAEAEFRRRQFDAEVNDMFAQVTARRREIEANDTRNASFVESLIKDRKAQSEDMAHQAEKEYAQALARLENLRSVRTATEQEGLVSINDMMERVQLTRDRVVAVANDLRREATSMLEQSGARASEYKASLASIKSLADARNDRLRAEADSTMKQAEANAHELKAQAASLEARASDEQHELRVASIETGWDQNQAEYR